MKEVLRREDAAYGGEMSATTSSGVLLLRQRDDPLAPRPADHELHGKAALGAREGADAALPASGEINRRVADPAGAIRRVRASYEASGLRVDETDGVGIEFDRWRFNLRMSNTEPLVRLNVESRADAQLMQAKTEEVLAVLDREAPGPT